jgi:hypothetical protein
MSTVDMYIRHEISGVTSLWAGVRSIVTPAADFARRVAGAVRMLAERRRQRAELLAYLASDHRAAADMGLKSIDFDWSNEPFGANQSRILEIPSLGPFARLR